MHIRKQKKPKNCRRLEVSLGKAGTAGGTMCTIGYRLGRREGGRLKYVKI